jgi:putative ABC transport system substrate-binding protein
MAQEVKRVPRLCFLTFDPGTPQSPAKRFEAFFERLRELGYVNGETITIDYLHPEGRSDRYPELAAECLRLKPDIIAVTTTPGAHVMKNATSTVPIVMVALGDPVGTKLVDSLSRPGANITGMSQMTSGLAAKRLELLKEAVPGLLRVLVLAYLVDPISPLQVQAVKEAAPSLGVTPYVIDIKTPDDLSAAFEAGSMVDAQGVLTTAESIFRGARARVTQLAARHKLPAIYRGICAGERRINGLRRYRSRPSQERCELRRQNFEGGEAFRSPRPAADQVPAGDQFENGTIAWADDSSYTARSCR